VDLSKVYATKTTRSDRISDAPAGVTQAGIKEAKQKEALQNKKGRNGRKEAQSTGRYSWQG
jgi:hypothetical protein